MTQRLLIDGAPVTLEQFARKGSELSFTHNGTAYCFRLQHGRLEQEIAPGQWQPLIAQRHTGARGTRVQVGAIEATIGEAHAGAGGGQEAAPLSPRAPMPGLVRQVLVKKGDKVKAGQPLLVMEAMKLQTTLSAGGDATVEALLVKEGDMVTEGAELVRLKAKA